MEKEFNRLIYMLDMKALNIFLKKYFSLPGWSTENKKRLKKRYLKGGGIYAESWRNHAQKLYLIGWQS